MGERLAELRDEEGGGDDDQIVAAHLLALVFRAGAPRNVEKSVAFDGTGVAH